jgi:hypothetical protein
MAPKLYGLEVTDEAESAAVAFENDLFLLVHNVARQMSTFANTEAQPLGVTCAQLIILARLERQPDVSQAELADAAEVTPITIARLIESLAWSSAALIRKTDASGACD